MRPGALKKAAAALQAGHPDLLVKGLACDVANRGSVGELLRAVDDVFGGAPVVYLGANAGVLFPSSTVLTGSADEWNLTLQVNVIGVVNTIQTFVPTMLAHGRDCCVVTTASIAGLVTGISGPYGTSKHAAVALTEALHHELSRTPGGERIRLHVLCPGLVNTPLMHTSNETTQLRDDLASGPIDGTKPRGNDATSKLGTDVMFAETAWKAAMTTEHVAERLFEGIADGSFYIMVGDNVKSGVEARHAGIQAIPSFHQTMSTGNATLRNKL